MASILLPSDATLEAHAHCCSASQVEEHLTHAPRERLRTHGHISVARSMESNKDPLGVMGLLLKQPEIQVNLPAFGGEEGNSLLHLAVLMQDEDEENRKGSLLLILKRPDLDPNVGNSKGDTPLHAAVRASSVQSLDILLDDPRVNLAALNYKKQTCLHVACEASKTETSDRIARKIIKSATSTVKSLPQFLRKQDQFGNTGLHYAAARGLENVLDAFLEAVSLENRHELAMKKNHQGNLAIHLAAKNGHLGVVERMLDLVDDSLFDDAVVNVKDQDGCGYRLLHQAVRSGSRKNFQLCIQKPTTRTFELYMKLIAVAPNKNIADFLLQRLNDEFVKNSEDKEDEYVANLLHFAGKRSLNNLVELIVKWYSRLAVVAMHEALETGNETIQLVVRDHPEVQREFVKMHRKYTYYVTAANAILVVAVLILTLTFGHCLTSVEAAQHREDIIDLKEFGGPSGTLKKVHWMDFFLLPRWAFLQAMVATVLAAFAALPFSFAFFFHEAVDDTQVKQLLNKTRVLIVSASYFLMLSLEALFFSFVCSQFIAPYIDYKCTLACEVALSVFLLCTALFLGFNFFHYWRNREKGNHQTGVIKFMEMLTIAIAR